MTDDDDDLELELEHLRRHYAELGGVASADWLARAVGVCSRAATRAASRSAPVPDWLLAALRAHLGEDPPNPKHLSIHHRRWIAVDHYVTTDAVSVEEAVARAADAEGVCDRAVWRSYQIVRALQGDDFTPTT
jgi:hypothetical protein